LIMSDRIAVFSEGRIQQVAAPKVLYEEPESAFVAQFIGENNRIAGKLVELEKDGLCAVRVNGHEVIWALPVRTGAVGSDTVLSLRPERVQIDPATGACENIFEAEVQEVIYIGNALRARLNTCGSQDFVVTMQNSANGRQLSRGEKVKVGWQARDCRALDLA